MLRTVLLLSLFVLASVGQGSAHTPKAPTSRASAVHAVAIHASAQVPALAAFVVEHKGAIVCEEYFHGATADTNFNIKSATKSFVSAIAGAANARGLLPDIDTPFLKIMPEYAMPDRLGARVWFQGSPDDSEAVADLREDDSLRRLVTLRHLLTMTSGFRYTEFGPTIDEYCWASDPVRFMIDLPFETEPGDTFNYCTGGADMFGAALARAVNTDLKTFADTALFVPAGIHIDRWATDPEGRRLGGSEMFCTAKDMLRLGELYLHKGLVNGRQLLPVAWIDASLSKQAELANWDVAPNVNGYGYFWWRRISHGHQLYFASGYGGQLICVIPDLDMVVVTICTLGKNNRGRSELKRLHTVIDQLIGLTLSQEN